MISMMCAITASTVLQAADRPPLRCIAPPRGASDWCVECYTRACSEWIDDYFKCGADNDCLQFALALYFIKMGMCDCGSHQAATVLDALNESQTRDALEALRAWGGEGALEPLVGHD